MSVFLRLSTLKRYGLGNNTSLRIRTQSRRPCRDVQSGGAVLLKNLTEPTGTTLQENIKPTYVGFCVCEKPQDTVVTSAT
jgi:hypothetical protein